MATQFSIEDGRKWKRRFFTIWTGQALSLMGSMLVQFALVWYLTVETGSATVLAMASLAAFLPQVVLGPLVGSLVDRWNRKKIMLVADSVVALTTLVLAGLFSFDSIEIWHIYLAAFIRSLGGAFHHGAMSASTSLMVPKEHLTRVQGFNQMLSGGFNVIAAPVGALLIEVMPFEQIMMIDVATALFAILPLFFFEIPQPDRAEQVGENGEKPSVWQDTVAGFQYMRSLKGVMIIAGMALLINFILSPASALFPLVIKEHFSGGAKELGMFEAAFGLGVILGGLTLGVWGGFKRQITTAMAGFIGFGISFMILGQLPPTGFMTAVGVSFFSGFIMPMINGSIMGIMQAIVAPEMQGRVFSLLGSMANAMTPVGLIIAGPLSDKIGVMVWYLAGGILCVVMGVIGFLTPALMNIEEGRGETLEDGEEKVASVPAAAGIE